MKKGLIFIVVGIIIGISLFSWATKKYNIIVEKDEMVNQAWSQVENVYQRRYDLIPNLVETVKGYAKHEQETFTQVTEARAKMGGVVDMGEAANNPEMMAKFQEAQAGISSALQRLMVVVEKYPELKANQNFLELQAQLEGTENRIAVERGRFNEAVQGFNTFIRIFPNSLVASITGFQQKNYFQMEPAAQKTPKVVF